MDPYDLPEEFSHLQAQDMSKLGFMQDLIRGIKKITAATDTPTATIKETIVSDSTVHIAPHLSSANTLLIVKNTMFIMQMSLGKSVACALG